MNYSSETKANPDVWLDWAKELQFIAQAGLTYSQDNFDLERFRRIRDIAAEIMALKSGLTLDTVRGLFCNETGFQTPKLDARAAVFQDDRILLVQERNGLWSLPGGWVDVNQSIRTNTVKEVKEEAGLDVAPREIDRGAGPEPAQFPAYAYNVCKVFVLCRLLGGEFASNIETTKSGFFALDDMPELAEDRTTKAQVAMCFQARDNQDQATQFD